MELTEGGPASTIIGFRTAAGALGAGASGVEPPEGWFSVTYAHITLIRSPELADVPLGC